MLILVPTHCVCPIPTLHMSRHSPNREFIVLSSTALSGDTGNNTITKEDKKVRATTVVLHEYSESVGTKNIFMATLMTGTQPG